MCVSAIIPTYNDGFWLPAAVGSCLRQSCISEIIIVDDGSSIPITDDVMENIRSFDKVKYYRKENGGLSSARNFGIERTENYLIIPLDADDFFIDDSVDTLFEAMTSDVDIIYGDMMERGKIIHPVMSKLTRKHFMKINPLFCSSLYRKSVWKKVSGYTVKNKHFFEDWNFWMKAYVAGCSFKYHPVLVYNHTIREGSMLQSLKGRHNLIKKISLGGL